MNLLRPSALFAAIVFLFTGLGASRPATAEATRADAEKDPVLKAMLEELDRSMTRLQLPGFEKPFFHRIPH